jgi:hypothetical protein
VDGTPARFRRNDWWGVAHLEVAGETFRLESPWSPKAHFSLTTKRWDRQVGDHLIEVVQVKDRWWLGPAALVPSRSSLTARSPPSGMPLDLLSEEVEASPSRVRLLRAESPSIRPRTPGQSRFFGGPSRTSDVSRGGGTHPRSVRPGRRAQFGAAAIPEIGALSFAPPNDPS